MPSRACVAASQWIYTIDANGTFSRFDPARLTFTDIGVLDCPAEPGDSPFSMAVDRSATAWVLYSSGELFTVDTSSLKCTKTAFADPSGLVNFGMGFVSNSAGAL